jgi:hypothetical protein
MQRKHQVYSQRNDHQPTIPAGIGPKAFASAHDLFQIQFNILIPKSLTKFSALQLARLMLTNHLDCPFGQKPA